MRMTPSGDEVRRQLDRLLASTGFANAGRMSRFLKFVVEQSLAGEGERLKEYVIGVEVFDRDTDYDPRVDAIVRVEAARLRTKLAEYYAGDGHGDAVVLSLPKGGYSPVIKIAERAAAATNGQTNGGTSSAAPTPPAPLASATTALRTVSPAGLRRWATAAVLAGAATLAVAAWAPWTALQPAGALRFAVLPFTPYPDAADAAASAVAMRVTEGVTAELVRDGRFAVVASSAASAAATASARPRDVAATLEADVLIEARLRTDGRRVRVEARASSGSREQKLWVGDFAGDAADSDALEREIATAVAAALGATPLVAN
jgi:TolB-like protein